MDYPKTVWKNNGKTYTFTWIAGQEENFYTPYTQVYGLVLDKNANVVMQRLGDGDWCLPGGTVENGETAIQTLIRELQEEVDVTIKNPIILGGQKVEGDGPEYYQLRYYCELDELLPQTPDPDNGEIRERRLVPISELNSYLKWGDTGEAIFGLAYETFKKNH